MFRQISETNFKKEIFSIIELNVLYNLLQLSDSACLVEYFSNFHFKQFHVFQQDF